MTFLSYADDNAPYAARNGIKELTVMPQNAPKTFPIIY